MKVGSTVYSTIDGRRGTFLGYADDGDASILWDGDEEVEHTLFYTDKPGEHA